MSCLPISTEEASLQTILMMVFVFLNGLLTVLGLSSGAQSSGTYNAAPDDDMLVEISLAYSTFNPNMYNGDFTQGITNGADWYTLYGGMQDWNYCYLGGFEVTLEVSNTKYPAENTLTGYWNVNYDSMINYMFQVHRGVKGYVKVN